MRSFISLLLILFAGLVTFAQQSLWVGESYTFDVGSSVIGSTTNIKWSTSGGYISLTGSGFYRKITVSQYFQGTATVTCEWDYRLTGSGSYTHTKRQVTITCKNNQVSISPTSLELTPGQNAILSYHHQYDNQYVSSANAYFQSTNPSVVKVNERTGEVTAISAGTAYVNIYSKISAGAPYCLVTVKKVDPISVSLPGSLRMTAGTTQILTPTLSPSNSQSVFTWSSSNTDVATVSTNGLITAKKHGRSTITVNTSNGLSAGCNLIVDKQELLIKSNINSGLVSEGSELCLTASDANAKIYYTTDGSEPNENSKIYENPIVVNKKMIVKAYAKHPDYLTSRILTLTFTVTPLISETSEMLNLYHHQPIELSFNQPIEKGVGFERIIVNKESIPQKYVAFIKDKKLQIVLDNISKETYEIFVPESAVKTSDGDPNVCRNLKAIYKESQGTEFASIGGSKECIQALTTNGQIYTWGWKDHIGRDDNNDADNPVKLNNLTGIISFDSENQSSVALASDGKLYGWGLNKNGELGLGHYNPVKYPEVILTDVKNAKIAGRSLMVVKKDGSLWASGENDYNHLGIGSNSPKFLRALTNVKKVLYVGNVISFILKEDESLWAIGGSASSYLGNGTTSSKTFVKILENVKDLKTYNQRQFLALTNSNELYGWGSNEYGELGLGHKNPVKTPQKVCSDVIDFAISHNHAFAINTDHQLLGWGDNEYGCLGTGNNNAELTPTVILEKIKEVATISNYTVAIDLEGRLYSWGDNGTGWYKSDGSSYSTKTRVLPEFILNDISSVYPMNPFSLYTYAIGFDGSLWKWTVTSPTKPIIEGVRELQKAFIEKEYTILAGERAYIQITLEPINSTYKRIKWQSENEDVVECLHNGVVLAKEEGETNVLITVLDYKDTAIFEEKIHVKVLPNNNAGVSDILYTKEDKVEYYNLSGLYCGGDKTKLCSGIYIEIIGDKARKIVIR